MLCTKRATRTQENDRFEEIRLSLSVSAQEEIHPVAELEIELFEVAKVPYV